MARALIADDEPLLRERLAALLARLWPELQVVAQARKGREALEQFDEWLPEVVFLDVHMPGLNGIETARGIGRRAQIVFVTAHDQYAVQAFEQGAVDYLVKPFDEARLADTVQRLRERLADPAAAAAAAPGAVAADTLAPLLDRLAEPHLKRPVGRPPRGGYEEVIDLGPYRAKPWRHAQRLILVIIDRPDHKSGQLQLEPDYFFRNLKTRLRW